jgi:ferrous iron transport protein B
VSQPATALADRIVSSLYRRAEELATATVTRRARGRDMTRTIDNLLTSRLTGFPIMLLTLGAVLWVTVVGANYPSQVIGSVLFAVEDWLTSVFTTLGWPDWLHGVLVLGMYRTLAWVVSVMLPPMAIFLPCFTLLEDLGYLPRVAFNLDAIFKAAGACGKQALTMSMGFGCNAAGIIACRIIDSPRERLIAVLTNNFIVCNGRFPTLIAVSAILVNQLTRDSLGASGAGAFASLIVVGVVLVGIVMTLAVSWVLSRTLLRGAPSFVALELPPFRRPQVGRVLVRSMLDRTIFVLLRAMTVAAPAGALVWVLGNTMVGGQDIVSHLAGILGPAGRFMGLDGFIVGAFILGLPANEIVLPILMMSYLTAGKMIKLDGLDALSGTLVAHGWTSLTALCYMLFSLLHWPCATTLLTVWKETNSRRWTLLAALIPTAVAVIVCIVVAQGARLLGLE